MNIDRHIKELFKLLEIPSISAQSTHIKDIRKAAQWLKNKFTSLGFSSDVMPTKGHPVVYAERIQNKNLKTILIYGHYDVQSPDPLDEWSSDPFKPEIKSGNIYARGVADDKGQLFTWIAALEELKDQKININLKLLIEGEEEVGSGHLNEFVKDNKTLLMSDICVISDTHCLSEDQPMIDYGLRGLTYVDLVVRTMPKDVHSGIYGGNVLNPVQVLSQIITKLKSEDHQILIPGFYKNVRKLGILERNKLKKLPFREEQVISETGATIVAGERGYSVHERAGGRPTLDINGVWGGYQGEGPKTIIPGEVHAKISMRLVPDQSPVEIFEKLNSFINKITPKGAEVKCDLISTAEPVIIDTKSVYFKTAEKSYKKVFGKFPVYELSGGTIGVVADLKYILGIDSIMMGYGLPDDGLHAPNEKFSLSMFEKGIRNNIEFLRSL